MCRKAPPGPISFAASKPSSCPSSHACTHKTHIQTRTINNNKCRNGMNRQKNPLKHFLFLSRVVIVVWPSLGSPWKLCTFRRAGLGVSSTMSGRETTRRRDVVTCETHCTVISLVPGDERRPKRRRRRHARAVLAPCRKCHLRRCHRRGWGPVFWIAATLLHWNALLMAVLILAATG